MKFELTYSENINFNGERLKTKRIIFIHLNNNLETSGRRCVSLLRHFCSAAHRGDVSVYLQRTCIQGTFCLLRRLPSLSRSSTPFSLCGNHTFAPLLSVPSGKQCEHSWGEAGDWAGQAASRALPGKPSLGRQCL